MNEGEEILRRLSRLEELLSTLVEARMVKEWYTVAEVAAITKKSDFTIREHCRLGRLRAKKAEGRGRGTGEWLVSHEELQRFRNEGPLPFPPRAL